MGNNSQKSVKTVSYVNLNRTPDFYWENDTPTRMTCSFKRPIEDCCIVHIIFEHPSTRIQFGKRVPDDELPEETRPDFSSMYVPKDWSDSHFSTWPVSLRMLCEINTGIYKEEFDGMINSIVSFYPLDEGLQQFSQWIEFWKPKCHGLVYVNFHE